MNLHKIYTSNYGWRFPYGLSVGSTLIIGAEGSGKTTLLQSALSHGEDLLDTEAGSGRSILQNLVQSRYCTLVTYSPDLIKHLAGGEDPQDLCLVLLAKNLASQRKTFANVLRSYLPWLTLSPEIMPREVVKVREDSHLQIVQALDALFQVAEEEEHPSWVLFDGFDANQDLAVGLLHLLGGFWRRWGNYLCIIVTARPETVKAAFHKGGVVDPSKVVSAGHRITWTAEHLWGLVSTHLLNTYGGVITTMKTLHGIIWGWRCVKSPTLDQVLIMAKRSGIEISKKDLAWLRRVDARKIEATPKQVLAVFLQEEG